MKAAAAQASILITGETGTGRFFEARKVVFMIALQAADSLEKAYVVACEYRALTGFVKMLEADVVVGTAAAQKLLEE